LQERSPGADYLIYNNRTHSLVYPTNGLLAETQPTAGATRNQLTPSFTVLYGWVSINGILAPVGARVEMLTPGGEVAGCYILEEPGVLKMTHVYGAEGTTIPGFSTGDPITMRVNGVTATTEIRLFLPWVR